MKSNTLDLWEVAKMHAVHHMTEIKAKITSKYCEERQRIIGIMLARYSLPLTEVIMKSCYQYWNANTGSAFDVFWAGYKEESECTPDEYPVETIIHDPKSHKKLFFSEQAFVNIKYEISSHIEEYVSDQITLLLFNCAYGELDFDNAIQINLEKYNNSTLLQIRELMEYITYQCVRDNGISVQELSKKIEERDKAYLISIEQPQTSLNPTNDCVTHFSEEGNCTDIPNETNKQSKLDSIIKDAEKSAKNGFITAVEKIIAAIIIIGVLALIFSLLGRQFSFFDLIDNLFGIV